MRYCTTTQKWVLGDHNRVKRREITENIRQYKKTMNREFLKMASFACENQDDNEFLHLVYDWMFAK